LIEPLPIRVWPELLQFGVLLEGYRLPPYFAMSPHVHEFGHGWLILDGGFEAGDGRCRPLAIPG
jgi:hypothetical protein